MEHENDGDINYNRCSWYSPQRTGRRSEKTGNKRNREDLQTSALLKLARILRRTLET